MIKVEESDLQHQNFVDSASRYNKSKILYWGPKKLITFETYKRTPIQTSPDDKVYVITGGTEYRPDLVSYKAYGDPRYWWKIMEFNKINDVMDFKSGRTIVIPSMLN